MTAVLLVVAACLPLLAVIAVRTGAPWTPTQDFAVIDLRVRDVWTSQIPLSGAYSRFGWNHPGPLMFYALAVPSLLVGKAAWATLVGGAVFQLVAIVWLGRATWKLGSPLVMFAFMLAVSLSYASTGMWMVVEPWNPHLAFPWFVLFVFYAWRLSLGETRRLPALAFVTSLLVQTHVGYVQVVIGAAAAVAVGFLIDARSGRRWQWPRRAVAAAGAIVVVLWAPVAVDAVVHPPGNLNDIVDFFVFGGASGPRNGFRSGLGLLGNQFTLPPEWLTGQRHILDNGVAVPSSPWTAVVPLLVFAVGVMMVRNTRRRDDARLLGLLAALVVYGLVSLARVIGTVAPYLFYWRIPLAILLVMSTAIAVVHRVAPNGLALGHRAVVGSFLPVVLVALPVLPMTVEVIVHGGRIESVARFERSVEHLSVQAAIERRAGERILVRSEGSTLSGVETGIIDALDRAGVDVKVDEARSFQFGEGRGAPGPVDRIWVVSEEGIRISQAAQDPDRRVVARSAPPRAVRRSGHGPAPDVPCRRARDRRSR